MVSSKKRGCLLLLTDNKSPNVIAQHVFQAFKIRFKFLWNPSRCGLVPWLRRKPAPTKAAPGPATSDLFLEKLMGSPCQSFMRLHNTSFGLSWSLGRLGCRKFGFVQSKEMRGDNSLLIRQTTLLLQNHVITVKKNATYLGVKFTAYGLTSNLEPWR